MTNNVLKNKKLTKAVFIFKTLATILSQKLEDKESMPTKMKTKISKHVPKETDVDRTTKVSATPIMTIEYVCVVHTSQYAPLT